MGSIRFFEEIKEPSVAAEIVEEELSAKTIKIKEGDSGFSYQNIFGPYIKNAKSIYITDPYVRLEYQIRNLILFAGIIDTSEGEVALTLITSSEDEYQERYLEQKLKELQASLAEHKIKFNDKFDPNIHDRRIDLDNGWSIYPGRGLDIYQKPESKYGLSEIDQTKRKCRETDIIFVKRE